MKKTLTLSLITVLMLSISAFAQTETKQFNVYTDKNAASNHFIPSGWMGATGDISLNDQSTDEPANGSTCIKMIYRAKKPGGIGWVGVYWQSSERNWGDKNTGYDLSDFNKLVFKAKGLNGGEIIDKIQVGGIISAGDGSNLAYPDSDSIEFGPIQLSSQWQEFSINLSGKDLSYINGGLAVVLSATRNANGATIYLDDIRYVFDPELSEKSNTITMPFYVYSDITSLDNHFIPSGWMGDVNPGQDIKLDNKHTENPYSGDSCIRVEYKDNSGGGWAGVYWQHPDKNWGNTPRVGFDLSNAKKVTFWARGEKGGETIQEFKIGGITSGEFGDSDVSGIGPIRLNNTWTKYEIDLAGKDLSYIIGGFCWATNSNANDPAGIVFYIDEIKYE